MQLFSLVRGGINMQNDEVLFGDNLLYMSNLFAA